METERKVERKREETIGKPVHIIVVSEEKQRKAGRIRESCLLTRFAVSQSGMSFYLYGSILDLKFSKL